MKARIVELNDPAAAIRALGADPKGVELMTPKAQFRTVKLTAIKTTAANIIKQEMLSIGGEAATAYGAINHTVPETDLLLFGTVKQLVELAAKLQLHQFNLTQVGAEIIAALNNYDSLPRPFRLGRWTLDLTQRVHLMGILNVTPDSFSDGGQFSTVEAAVARGKQLAAEGADIIDIGGESTRPGAEAVSVEEEKKRVLPVIERLAQETDVPISIDTYKSPVAAAALKSGAVMINDISGLHFDPRLADLGAPLCLMHIKGTPKDMQENPVYTDLMGEIIDYLAEGLAIAKKAGILSEQILVDPGIGFGKTVKHNLEILGSLRELKVLGAPILVGPSRKSFIGQVLDRPPGERLEGTAAAVAVAVLNGANVIRVHDVGAMSRVVKMTEAIARRQG
jgi:dihydropteroate synthase